MLLMLGQHKPHAEQPKSFSDPGTKYASPLKNIVLRKLSASSDESQIASAQVMLRGKAPTSIVADVFNSITISVTTLIWRRASGVVCLCQSSVSRGAV